MSDLRRALEAKLSWSPYDAEIPPVEKITETFCTVPLDDALPTTESREIEHVLRELLHAVLQADETPVDDVDAVAHRVGYVLLHEAPETWQIRRDTGNPHDRALGRRVSPWLVIRGEHTQVASSDELLVVETK